MDIYELINRRKMYEGDVLTADERKRLYEKQCDSVKNELTKQFRPEFINRLDEVIVFHQLSRDNVREITDIELKKVKERFRERGLELEVTPEAKDYVIDEGYHPDYGARPLRRAIEKLVEDPLSEEILRLTGDDRLRRPDKKSLAAPTRIVARLQQVDDVKSLVFEFQPPDEPLPIAAAVAGEEKTV